MAKKKRNKKGAVHTKETKEALKRFHEPEKNRYVSLLTTDGYKVTVDLKGNPLLRMYRHNAIDAPQLAAGNLVARDYEASNYSGIRGAGFEPKVDHSGRSSADYTAIDASRRLAQLRQRIKDEKFLLLIAVCGRGLTFDEIRREGGDRKEITSEKLRDALNGAAAFYSLIQKEPPTRTLKALQVLLQDLAAEAGEFVR